MSQRSVCSPKFIEHFQTYRHLNGWILDFVNVVYIFSQRPQLKALHMGRVFAFAASCTARAVPPQTTWKVVGWLVGFEPAAFLFFFTLFMTQAA